MTCWGRLALAVLAVVLPTVGPGDLQSQPGGQSRASFEFRVGAAVPTGDFGNVDVGCPVGSTGCDFPLQVGAEPGWRWEARGRWGFGAGSGVNLGYGQARFGCSTAFCGRDAKPRSKAVTAGVDGTLAWFGRMRIWAEAGVQLETVSVVRTRDQAGEADPKAVWYSWSPGLHGALGVELPFTEEGSFLFSPGFRFHRTVLDPPAGHEDMTGVSATYYLAELGFRFLTRKR